METAKNDSNLLMKQGKCQVASEAINVAKEASSKSITCYRCGGPHYASVRKHSKTKCNACHKTGHFASVCKSKKQQGQSNNSGQKKNAHKRPVYAVDNSEQSSTSQPPVTYNMWSLKSSISSPPYVTTLEVAGRPLRLEVDTGASVSIIGQRTFVEEFPELQCEPSDVILRSYRGDLSKVQGKVVVPVRFLNKEATLPLYVARDQTPTLLGRDWINALGISLADVKEVTAASSMEGILKNHKEVFSDGLGTLKGVKAKITIPEGARPKFFKPRKIPFALQDKVAQELQRLQRDGIICPVRTSEWAAPIVPVLKHDGRVRICGDFKVTVNPVTILEKYPVPRLEDLWAKLSGGVKFTKLDLKDAYQQVELEPESQMIVTINTP
ncbi:uncharacterized protein K02A2.6-like, partial [Ixodes scapularis]|uniref:uncharacterized protein K02A2.6-like n=1 Tax=Ixodes scapularis TaxID=6945 RepID=UPI001C385DE8